MFRTATTTPTTAVTGGFGFDSESGWREFNDRDANQDRIASDLAGADEPGF